MVMPARWMPEPTPIEAMIAASVKAEHVPATWPAPTLPIIVPTDVTRSRHPAAIAAQERRRIARLAQRTREINEAARRRAHRLALEASMDAARTQRTAEWGED